MQYPLHPNPRNNLTLHPLVSLPVYFIRSLWIQFARNCHVCSEAQMSHIPLYKATSGIAPSLFNEYRGVCPSFCGFNTLASATCDSRRKCRIFHFTRQPLVSLPVYLMNMKVYVRRSVDSIRSHLPRVIRDAKVANSTLRLSLWYRSQSF